MKPSLRPSNALERRVFLTIVVGLLPLAVLALIFLLRAAHQQRLQMLESAQGAMRAMMSAVDAELSATASSLDALAASPRLARHDYAGLHAEAEELLSRRPAWLNIVLSDTSAHQLMNARLPADAPLPSSIYPGGVAMTAQTGRTNVGDVIYSPVLETYGFAVQVPIRGAKGDVTQVLSAVLSPNALRQLLVEQSLPPQGVVGILDRRYNLVARSVNHEGTVGKPASTGLVGMLRQGRQSGWSKIATLEGLPVYTVIHRSPSSGWTVAIGIPQTLIDAPVLRSYVIFGALIAGSVLVGIIAALLVSRQIIRPMQALKAAAEALKRGEAPEVPTTPLPEIRDVAAALAAAHAERESLLAFERHAKDVEHEARLAAERASRLKDEFLAMLGHELRNPLAAISSAALVIEAAVTRPNSEVVLKNAAGIVRRQSGHLARLTDDLLDAARVVLGRIQLDTQPIDLAAVVQSVLETLRNTGRLTSHRVSASLQPVWIQGDAIRMEQVASNLIINAIKYTPHGGQIDIVTEHTGTQAHFRVRDSGIGIEANLMPRLFDLFTQGARALDRAQGGLGIGLTMVKRLVELHGGAIQVVSGGKDQGSEFIVALPAIAAKHASAESPHTRQDVAARKIAIVEDNADVRASLRSLLELAGHSVHEAADGRAGLSLILAQQPDVALIDVGLPVIDGLEVARALRADANGRSLYLIGMSGYGGPDEMRRGLEAGFDEYLVKPVDQAKLQEIIRRASPNGNVVRFVR